MRVAQLSGGVGGARMARGFAALDEIDLSVIVNVGDDQVLHGLHISPDLDTVVYTIAEVEGPMGWGRAGDSFTFNDELKRLDVGTEFRLGDKDLAVKVFRTARMASGAALSEATAEIAAAFGVDAAIIPATDDPLRTQIRVEGLGWLGFSEYFVTRGHRDDVLEVRFADSEEAAPAPAVTRALEQADLVVIGPSNPPLSIWPILAVPGIAELVRSHPRVVAVSPLIAGKALKGPADRVLESLGLGSGNRGVAASYEGLIDGLVVHEGDLTGTEEVKGVVMMGEDTLIKEPGPAAALARRIVAAWS